MTHASSNPTLPQKDSAAGRQKRVGQLATARTQYAWASDNANLPGVPLANVVPANDKPTLPWFILVIGIGLEIAHNLLEIKLSQMGDLADESDRDDIEDTQNSLRKIETSIRRIARDHGQHSGINFFTQTFASVENFLENVAHGKDLLTLAARADELKALVDTIKVEGMGHDAEGHRTIEAYRALFASLAVPGIAYNFQDDDVFARLRVAGPNPVLIKGIEALPANFPLTAAQYQSVINGDTLVAALADGRLFLLDYAELSILQSGSYQGIPKFAYQPMALFAIPPGGTSLKPVAIQCGQDSAANPIFTPSDVASDKWGWDIAKFVVQVADGNYHELFAHLARTHLVMEAFTVATHRHLANVHPLWALLVPHFEGSLFINNLAAGSLIAQGGPIDHIFGGTISSTQSAAVRDRLAFDFQTRMLPNDLTERKVTTGSKLADYPYRDDALLVWKAIRDWAKDYIETYYASDADVTGDTELTAWATDVQNEGKVKGFGAISSREQLIDTCTMIIFTGSAQHAAVNFPQKDFMSFAPAVTGAGWEKAPTQQAGHDRQAWLGYMPSLQLALEQLNTLYLLGSVHYRPLGTYLSNDFPYPDWFRDPAMTGPNSPLAHFQAALVKVEAEINSRNALRRQPYPYMLPSLIPTSINI